MTTEQNSKAVEAAYNEMVRLAAREQSLEAEREQRIAQLAAFRESGSVALESEQPIAEFVSKIRDREIEIELLERSIEVARNRRRPAIKMWYSARAAELRCQAQSLREESAALRHRAAPLLVELSSLMGIRFDASILCAQRNEHWLPPMLDGEDPALCAPGQGMIPNNGILGTAGYFTPRFASLIFQSRQIDNQAGTFEAEKVVGDAGDVSGNGFEHLLERLAEASRPETIVPTLRSVSDWAKELEQQVRSNAPYLATQHNGQRLYRLVWANGTIDRMQSSLSFQGGAYQGVQMFQAPVLEGPWRTPSSFGPFHSGSPSLA